MGRKTFSKEYKLQTTRQVIKEGKRTAEVSVKPRNHRANNLPVVKRIR